MDEVAGVLVLVKLGELPPILGRRRVGVEQLFNLRVKINQNLQIFFLSFYLLNVDRIRLEDFQEFFDEVLPCDTLFLNQLLLSCTHDIKSVKCQTNALDIFMHKIGKYKWGSLLSKRQ